MKSGFIKYSLFKSRKNFNPLSLFYKNHNLTYKDFVSFLHSRNVESPGEDYYKKVKIDFDLKTKSKKENKEFQDIKETISITDNDVIEEQKNVIDEEPVIEEIKIKSKKRKKNEKNFNNKTDSDE